MTESTTSESIVLGGGCFWCLEAAYNEIVGVHNVVCGYAGGHISDPTYTDVISGDTGHAEVVEVTFDTALLSLDDIFDIFWVIHDPTTLNRQGHDIGTQYRSIIFYASTEQENTATRSIEKISKLWPDPVTTELVPLGKFYPAEDYHQNYFAKNPTQGYCVAVINPKLIKLREKFRSKLKTSI
jgi:peptide-methionine (S)-S-oxide reductase